MIDGAEQTMNEIVIAERLVADIMGAIPSPLQEQGSGIASKPDIDSNK